MTTRGQREFLKVQLIETQRLKGLADGHPLMSAAFAEREGELKDQIDAIPLGSKESRAVLFFSGEPVLGSIGIDAVFASRVIEPFQKMVAADYVNRWHGKVGSRGRRFGEANSRLLLSGLPRGSFGLELTRAANDDLFVDGELADTLAHVTRLVDSSVRSDEDFAAELDDVAPRVVQNLKSFLEVISKGKAGLRLESGDFRCEMSQTQAANAFSRVAETTTHEEEVKVTGVLKGVLLDSWAFNFSTDDGASMVGKIDQNLTDERVIEFNDEHFNKRCVATLCKTTVAFKNGRSRVSYQLANIEPFV